MIVLDDWQKEILDYEGDILVAKGRRIGATHTFAVKAIEYLMSHENTHPSAQIVCVSLTEDQAKLIIMFALQYADLKYKKFIGKGKDKPTQNQIIMKVNGNRRILLARPVGNTGDSARGFEGQVLMVDEASRMPALFWIAAKPILLTTGGRIWMWSTFNGTDDYFYKSFDEAYNKNSPEARFKVWFKTTKEVIYNRQISEGWTEKQREGAIRVLEEEERDMPGKFFMQEYMGIPLTEINRFFSDAWIERVCTGKRQLPSQFITSYMGCDIARMGGDETTIEIGRWENDRLIQTESIGRKSILTTETERLILEQNKIWNPARLGIDAGAGSLGVSIYDHLMENLDVRKKLRAMNNRKVLIDRDNNGMQRFLGEDMFFNLKAMGERKEIVLLDDSEIILSLKSVQMIFTNDKDKNSKIRFVGSYTHHAEGIKRMAFLAKKEKSLKFEISYI